MTQPAPEIDTTLAHSPRTWNHWLGGTDHDEIDRRIGDQFVQLYPPIVDVARASRFFDGLELLEPGVVSCSRWRRPAEAGEVDEFGGVGRRTAAGSAAY